MAGASSRALAGTLRGPGARARPGRDCPSSAVVPHRLERGVGRWSSPRAASAATCSSGPARRSPRCVPLTGTFSATAGRCLAGRRRPGRPHSEVPGNAARKQNIRTTHRFRFSTAPFNSGRYGGRRTETATYPVPPRPSDRKSAPWSTLTSPGRPRLAVRPCRETRSGCRQDRVPRSADAASPQPPRSVFVAEPSNLRCHPRTHRHPVQDTSTGQMLVTRPPNTHSATPRPPRCTSCRRRARSPPTKPATPHTQNQTNRPVQRRQRRHLMFALPPRTRPLGLSHQLPGGPQQRSHPTTPTPHPGSVRDPYRPARRPTALTANLSYRQNLRNNLPYTATNSHARASTPRAPPKPRRDTAARRPDTPGTGSQDRQPEALKRSARRVP